MASLDGKGVLISGGSIINISSIAGLGGSLYSASCNATKGAVRLFTKMQPINAVPIRLIAQVDRNYDKVVPGRFMHG